MKRTFILSVLALALTMICQSAFAYDYHVNGIYYRKATQQLPGGGCGETYLIVVNDDEPNISSFGTMPSPTSTTMFTSWCPATASKPSKPPRNGKASSFMTTAATWASAKPKPPLSPFIPIPLRKASPSKPTAS